MNIKKICLLAVTCLQATVFISAQKIAYKTAAETGAISQISLENDSSQMNWTFAPDHSQYEWIGKEYGWGLGNFQLRITNYELRDYKWETPEQSNANGTHIVYRAGDILQYVYGTLRAMYRQFGYNFYAIDIPIELSQKLLHENSMTVQADTLLADFKTMGDTFVQNSTNYPSHEVNYEQSIVAPSIITLLQLYRVTGEKRYLESAELQLTLLEAFEGQQPSYHLNDIAIRHWDGYWFGKRESWGDTFPHYWSTLDAVAFHLYAQITRKKEYEERAKNNLRNNLCLFTEDGRGSCAYIYPYKVNGQRAQFYDPYANDQDWALYFYLQILNAK
jgi:hypothetical protein